MEDTHFRACAPHAPRPLHSLGRRHIACRETDETVSRASPSPETCLLPETEEPRAEKMSERAAESG